MTGDEAYDAWYAEQQKIPTSSLVSKELTDEQQLLMAQSAIRHGRLPSDPMSGWDTTPRHLWNSPILEGEFHIPNMPTGKLGYDSSVVSVRPDKRNISNTGGGKPQKSFTDFEPETSWGRDIRKYTPDAFQVSNWLQDRAPGWINKVQGLLGPSPQEQYESRPRPPLMPPQQYTIQRGDTLSQVAQRLGMSVDDLAQANSISDPNMIREGQVLDLAQAQRHSSVAWDDYIKSVERKKKRVAEKRKQKRSMTPTKPEKALGRNRYQGPDVSKPETEAMLNGEPGAYDWLTETSAPVYDASQDVDLEQKKVGKIKTNNTKKEFTAEDLSPKQDTNALGEYAPSESFVNYIKNAENDRLLLGLDQPTEYQDGKQKAYGYGVKVTPTIRKGIETMRKSGMKEDVIADKVVRDSITEHRNRAKGKFNRKYGKTAFDNLRLDFREMLTEIEYNNEDGIDEYPKMVRAMGNFHKTGDVNSVNREFVEAKDERRSRLRKKHWNIK